MNRNYSLHFFSVNSKPLMGGIAEGLHHKCDHLGKLYDVTLHSTISRCTEVTASNFKIEFLSQPNRESNRFLGNFFPFAGKINSYLLHREQQQWAERDTAKLSNYQTIAIVGNWTYTAHLWCEGFRRFNIPYVLMCHGAELICDGANFGIRESFLREDLRGASMLEANSAATAQLISIAAKQEVPVRIINPGIDPGVMIEISIPFLSTKLQELKIQAHSRIILSVGRLVKRKGFHLVIESLASLKNEYPDLVYVVAGSGDEAVALKSLATKLGVSDKVFFLGEVNEETKWALYAACEFFVMPNQLLAGKDFEGFGLVFLEAALAAKPSIGGKNGGVPDAIADKETGLLVDTNTDYRQTAQAIAYLLENIAARDAMGRAAKERALSRYGWSSWAQRFSDVVVEPIIRARENSLMDNINV